MSQENLQTIIMQNFWRVKEVYYGIVQVVNDTHTQTLMGQGLGRDSFQSPPLLSHAIPSAQVTQ